MKTLLNKTSLLATARRASIVGVLLGLLMFAARAPIAAQQLPLIKIAASTNDTTTSALYAVKAGLFKKAGLNVELSPMNSGAAIAAAIAGGAIQIGNSSLLDLIEAHVKHLPFTLVGSSGMIDEHDVQYGAVVVRKDSPIRTARDLDGKTIAVPALNDYDWITAMAWMDKNGGNSSTVRTIELSSAAALQGVVDGRIDATVLATPLLTQGVETGGVRVIGYPFNAIARRYIYAAWFTTQDYVSAHRDVIERFSRVMHDAAVYCNAHKSETVDMIAEFGKVDPAIVQRMARVTFVPYLTGPLIQPLIDAAVKYKVIDNGFDAQELISPYALKPPR